MSLLPALLLVLLLASSCTPEPTAPNANNLLKEARSASKTLDSLPIATSPAIQPLLPFDRSPSHERLKEKITQGKPLVVHLSIPLCDNAHQGIVPVSEQLGNGLDLRHNLYWGAKYGFKNYFKRYTDWKLVKAEQAPNDVILERVVFQKELASGSTIWIVADAYRGDQMKACLETYLAALSGNLSETVLVEKEEINLHSQADLLIFNGHNGLMDYGLAPILSKDQQQREAAVIGCISEEYFRPHLMAAKAYPVLLTTGYMAPEAYVLEGLIETWMAGKHCSAIRTAAGAAYQRFHKCGLKGALNLFSYDWE